VKPKVIIYCDGACSPNPGIGGWAALLISPKQGKEKVFTGAEADTTNNRMELTAAIKGLEALKVPCEVDIHTDSQYSDLATYEQPLRYAEGIEYVVVNGKVVLDAGRLTSERPGRVLTRR